MKKITLILVLCLLSALSWSSEIHLKVDGKNHSLIKIEDLKKLKPVKIEFFNTVTRRAELYLGVEIFDFMQKFYPENLNVVEVEFISQNGLNSFVNKDLLEKTQSILAYDRADGDKFVRFSQKEKILVPLGPLYLVWELKGMPKEDRLLHRSIYQIHTINLLTNKIDFGLKDNAVDASVYLGYQAYKSQCLSCHALGKVGGLYSFDLVKAKTFELKGADYIKKYILDSRMINPKTKMLPFPKFKNSEDMITGIVDFLKFMQNPDELLKKKKSASGQKSYKDLKHLIQEMR